MKILGGEERIIRVSERRGAVVAFGALLIERSAQPYPFYKIWICNIFSTESDEVSQACFDEFSGVFATNADVQDQLAAIDLSQVVNHRVAGQRSNRGSRKVSQLSHEKYVGEFVGIELFINVFSRRQS